MTFAPPTQSLYPGSETGVSYIALEGGRLRFLGGSTNHWGGWCRPLDEIDFESRDWVPHSGWPFARKEIEPYFARAQELVEAGPWVYDAADDAVSDSGAGAASWAKAASIPAGSSSPRRRNGILPTHFGQRYQNELKRAAACHPLAPRQCHRHPPDA